MSDSTSISSLPNAVVSEPKQVQKLGTNNVKLEVKELKKVRKQERK